MSSAPPHPPEPDLVDATTGPLRVGVRAPRRSRSPAALGLVGLGLVALLLGLPRVSPTRAVPIDVALPAPAALVPAALAAPSLRPSRPAPAVRSAEPGQRRQRRAAGR